MSTPFYSVTKPRARKHYPCYLCNKRIPTGEQHEKVAGLTDGDFWSTRMHFSCADHTMTWTSEDWEYHDPVEFRKFYLEGDN